MDDLVVSCVCVTVFCFRFRLGTPAQESEAAIEVKTVLRLRLWYEL